LSGHQDIRIRNWLLAEEVSMAVRNKESVLKTVKLRGKPLTTSYQKTNLHGRVKWSC